MESIRWFGERLNIQDFSNGLNDPHCYLPHAVEGFFTNGGKRVCITRVLDTTLATRASAFLFNRGVTPGANRVLLRDMGENTGTAANLPLLLVLPDTELTANDWIRIGDGSDAEYRQAAVITTPNNVAIPLSLSLSRSHADLQPRLPCIRLLLATCTNSLWSHPHPQTASHGAKISLRSTRQPRKS